MLFTSSKKLSQRLKSNYHCYSYSLVAQETIIAIHGMVLPRLCFVWHDIFTLKFVEEAIELIGELFSSQSISN